MENILLTNFHFFVAFLDFEDRQTWFSAKNFNTINEKSILRAQANVLEKNSFVELIATFSFHSRTLIEVFRVLIETTLDFSRKLCWTFVKTPI